MTDNEIIKALECCTNHNALDNCDTCPLCDYGNCQDTLIKYCSNTINRQNAEIEKLKTQLGKSENFFTIKLDKEQLNDIVKSQIEKFEVDATEVVRCKDCINRNTEDCAMYYQCNCGEQHTWESDNDYCSWGKRKMEDTDD